MGDEVTSRGGDPVAERIKELCRSHAELAIRALVDVADDPEARDAARVKAADVLLQRGFGAPERRVEQKVDVTLYDERQAHLVALQRLADRREKAIAQKHDREEAEEIEYEDVRKAERDSEDD